MSYKNNKTDFHLLLLSNIKVICTFAFSAQALNTVFDIILVGSPGPVPPVFLRGRFTHDRNFLVRSPNSHYSIITARSKLEGQSDNWWGPVDERYPPSHFPSLLHLLPVQLN